MTASVSSAGWLSRGALGCSKSLFVQTANSGRVFKQVTARDPLHHEAGTLRGQSGVELLDGGFDLGQGGLFVSGGFRRGRKLRRLMQGMRDGFGGQGPIRRKEQRFDNAGQVHPTIFWKTAPKGKR